jgi:hypothetical protein
MHLRYLNSIFGTKECHVAYRQTSSALWYTPSDLVVAWAGGRWKTEEISELDSEGRNTTLRKSVYDHRAEL